VCGGSLTETNPARCWPVLSAVPTAISSKCSAVAFSKKPSVSPTSTGRSCRGPAITHLHFFEWHGTEIVRNMT
jgi:hypothetical protein